MPSVAQTILLNLLLALQLSHPFLFLRGLLRSVPLLGLTAFTQRGCAIRQTFTVNALRCRPQPRRQILRSLRGCCQTNSNSSPFGQRR